MPKTPYELLGKEEGIRKLAKAFYKAMDELPEVKGIRNMHGACLHSIEEKLFEYMNGWLGGPHLYHEKYGTICLTAPHKAYEKSESERDQWLLCWNKALSDINAPEDLVEMMKQPIFQLASFMMNHR